MDIKLFDSSLNLIGIIDRFTSLTWTQKYSEPGSFILKYPITAANNLIDTECFIIPFSEETPEIGIIETIIKEVSASGVETATASGRFASALLEQWVSTSEINYTSEYPKSFFTAYSQKIASIADEDLKSNFWIESSYLLKFMNAKKITYTSEKDDFLTILQEICELEEIGFKVVFTDGFLSLRPIIGVDRTSGQDTNNQAVFSRDFENIVTQTYTKSQTDFYNYGYVYADKNDVEFIEEINNQVGDTKREILISGSSVKTKNDEDVDLTDTEFRVALQTYGQNEMLKNVELENFEGTIDLNSTEKLGIDFDLGDLVTIYDSTWNLTLNTQITETERIFEHGNVSTAITFGSKIPTIFDKLKKI